MEQILYEFPVNEVNITLPSWVEELNYWLRHDLRTRLAKQWGTVVSDIDTAVERLAASDSYRYHCGR